MAIAYTRWESRGRLLALVKTSKRSGGNRKILAVIIPDRSTAGNYQAMIPGVAEALHQDRDVEVLKGKIEEVLLESRGKRE